MTRLSLALLGPVQISTGGQPIGGFTYNKARALLAYLALEAERPHHRDALAALLWPELPDAAARHNLRQVLTNLRTAIGDASATPPFLHITRDTIQFNRGSDHELDVATFTDLLTACETHAHRHLERCRSCAARIEQAISLYHGDFLAGFSVGDSAPFEEWQLRRRERLHQQALAALVQLADYHERHSEDEPARHYAQRQLALDPWREEAHRQMIRLLARGHQRSAALAQYEACRRILARDLGVEPEAETTALYTEIRDKETRREEDKEKMPTYSSSPFLRVSATLRYNLPTSPTPLIGREAELADLGALLENPACRLITIAGPGGIGKTRLALAAATEQSDTFTHGAAFVPLQAISSAAFLAPAILSALDIPLQGQRDPREQLLDYLRGKELLLVLDNLEQLLAPGLDQDKGVANLLADMLHHAPGVTLLVTSRERLVLPGEWLFDLSGLNYPISETIDGIEDYSAVQLFVQRAHQVRRQFALVDGEVRAVARICRLVEGLPLAIELAAAALRTRTCTTIVAAIESNLSPLKIELRGVPERHRSIRATFEHSWHLLSDEERQVFPQLSVFRGGFEEAAAAQVAQASPQLLAALLDKSLLRWDGVARYDMHELVRQYASEKLEEIRELGATRQQHAVYFLALAEKAEPHLFRAEQLEWFDRLEVEHNNLRAALAWNEQEMTVESGLRLASALHWFWCLRGHSREGWAWLERPLAASDSASASIQAKALCQAGELAMTNSDLVIAASCLETSLALYRPLGDRRGSARALGLLAWLAYLQGHLIDMRSYLAESEVLYRSLDDSWGIAYVLLCLPMTMDPGLEIQSTLNESLARFRQVGERWGVACALNNLGMHARVRGEYLQAKSYFAECQEVWEELRAPDGIIGTLINLGFLAQRQGDAAGMSICFTKALRLARDRGDRTAIASGLEGMGGVAGMVGQPLRAAQLLGAADALFETIGRVRDAVDSDDYAYSVTQVRDQLDEATFSAAYGVGREMTLEQAIAYALEVCAVDVEQPARASVASNKSG